jgi:hypothetical protein
MFMARSLKATKHIMAAALVASLSTANSSKHFAIDTIQWSFTEENQGARL